MCILKIKSNEKFMTSRITYLISESHTRIVLKLSLLRAYTLIVLLIMVCGTLNSINNLNL